MKQLVRKGRRTGWKRLIGYRAYEKRSRRVLRAFKERRGDAPFGGRLQAHGPCLRRHKLTRDGYDH